MITDVYPERGLFHARYVLSMPNASILGTILTGSSHSVIMLAGGGLCGLAGRCLSGCGGSSFLGINYITPEGKGEKEEGCEGTVCPRRRVG